MKNDYSILALCDNLEVSTSGYYDWQKRCSRPGPRAVQNLALIKEIKKIHALFPRLQLPEIRSRS